MPFNDKNKRNYIVTQYPFLCYINMRKLKQELLIFSFTNYKRWGKKRTKMKCDYIKDQTRKKKK